MANLTALTVTMRLVVVAVAFCLVVGAPQASSSPRSDLIVNTTAGPVEGFKSTSNFNAFLGIPFASAQRWEIPVEPSSWTQPFQAKKYGPICPQLVQYGDSEHLDEPRNQLFAQQPWNIVMPPRHAQSEDCLNLNVYAPANATKTAVMVWIYGGNLQFGDGTGYNFSPDTLVGKDVVLVTFNYRLGPLGYFSHPELNYTNFGLYDQIKALEWVRDNIELFGGDPENVTVFGQSSGGASVGALLVSPLSKNLFDRAIIESMPTGGVQGSLNMTLEEAAPLGADLGETLGIEKGIGQLRKMKETSFADIVKARSDSYGILIDKNSMDTDVLTGILEGRNHQVPLIIGSNHNEGGLLYNVGGIFPIAVAADSPRFQRYEPANTTQKYEGYVREFFDSMETDADDIFSFYPSDEPIESGASLLTDTLYTTQAVMIAEAMADRGEDVRLYHFTQTPEGEAGKTMGAFHTSEMVYVGISNGRIFGPSVNATLANRMSSYWTNFARTGDPNADGLAPWEKFSTAGVEKWFVLGPNPNGNTTVPKEKLDLLKGVVSTSINGLQKINE